MSIQWKMERLEPLYRLASTHGLENVSENLRTALKHKKKLNYGKLKC